MSTKHTFEELAREMESILRKHTVEEVEAALAGSEHTERVKTKHTEDEIDDATNRFEDWADNLDPYAFEDIGDLRAVAEAADAVRAHQARLREAVQVARGHGRSWNRIAVALGVSRQAARQRFADKTSAWTSRRPKVPRARQR